MSGYCWLDGCTQVGTENGHLCIVFVEGLLFWLQKENSLTGAYCFGQTETFLYSHHPLDFDQLSFIDLFHGTFPMAIWNAKTSDPRKLKEADNDHLIL